jgi:hypothetical protein
MERLASYRFEKSNHVHDEFRLFEIKEDGEPGGSPSRSRRLHHRANGLNIFFFVGKYAEHH